MRFYLISDNIDTQMGMRLAGIEGVVAHTESEVGDALDYAVGNEDIAVVLMTEKLAQLCRERIREIRLGLGRPLIAEIPDRHGDSDITAEISRYIEEAIGVKL